MYKIALLTHPYLTSWFQDAIAPLQSKCEIDLLPFEKHYELLELLPSLAGKYDGLSAYSASGERFLQQSGIVLSKPCLFLNRYVVDYFKAFFILINQNRSLDFTQVILDTSLIRPDARRSLADVVRDVAVFEEDRVRYIQELSIDDYRHMEEIIEEAAIRLWREGVYTHLVCRFANIAEAMEREGIPYVFVYPEKHRVADALDSLVDHILLEKQSGGLPASIMIMPNMDASKPFQEISQDSVRIQRALLDFSKNYASNFTVHFISQGFEILTSHLTVEKITSNHTYCQLGYYLFSTLGISFRIGYGIGYHIANARENAILATKASADSGMSCIVNGDEDPIPLQTRPSLMNQSVHSASAVNLSKQTGLSPITLQRISSALQFMGTTDVTNSELAEALQVTVANANRFIHTLMRNGFAEITDIKRSMSKGRPSRIYRIQL